MNRINGVYQSQWNQWMAALAATLAMVNVGNEEFWTLEVLKIAADPDSTLQKCINFVRAGYFVAATSSVFGAILGAVFADRFGRKNTLLATSILAIIQITGVFFINTCWSCVPLFFGEIGLGITRVVVPLYVSEIVEDNIRGALLMLQLPFFYAGKLIAIGIGSLVSPAMLSVVSMILIVIFLATFTQFPETPYYLASKKKYEAAAKSLTFYRGVKNNVATDEIELIIKNVEAEGDSQGCCEKIKDLVRANTRKGLFIIMFVIIAKWNEQIWDSWNELTVIVTHTWLSNRYHARITVYAINLIASILIVFTIDVIGRRSFLLYATFGNFIIIILAIIVRANNAHEGELLNHGLPTALHFCQLIILSVQLVYVGELFSTNAKALAIAVATILDLFVSFVIIALSTVTGVDLNSFFIEIMLLIAFPITFAFIPETKQKSFSQIQSELSTTLHCKWLRNKLMRTNQTK